MNPLNFFKFLEKEKGKPIPLKVKLIHGLPLTPDELNVKGDLFLHDTNITSLPQGLKIGGHLTLDNTSITSLPDGLKVKGDLYLNNTDITSLPQGLQVGGDLDLTSNDITSLPFDLKVEGNIWLRRTPLAGKSDDEILAMLKKGFFKTGYIKGFIDT
jgi:hypothetical protein